MTLARRANESDLERLLRASIEIVRLQNLVRAQRAEIDLLRERGDFDLSADALPALLRPQA